MKVRTTMPLTLVEVLLTITLLGFIASTLCYRGFETLRFYRANMAKEKLKEELNLAKHLSSSYQIDINLNLYQAQNKWHLKRSGLTDTKAVAKELKQYFSQTVSLAPMHIESEAPLTITYFGNGKILSRQKIKIADASGNLETLSLI